MRRLEHVGIATPDATAAARIFEALLGRRPYAAETVEREGVRTTFIEAGSTKIELLESIRADSSVARHLERRGAGLHHLAFEVDDLEGVATRLENGGFRILGDPSPGADGKRILFVHPKDAAGVLVEFCQQSVDGALPDGSGPDGAPASLVIGGETDTAVVRALARRLRVWTTRAALPAEHFTVMFGGPHDVAADVLVDPAGGSTAGPGALVIVRGVENPATGGDTLVRIPRHLLDGLPDPAATVADLIAAHLIA